MVLVEFIEFLARISEVIYEEDKIPLAEKISKVLPILLNLVEEKFFPLLGDDEISSESDYDDDIVDTVMQKRFGGP